MLNENLDFDINNKESLVSYFDNYLNNHGWNNTTQSEQAFYQNATSNFRPDTQKGMLNGIGGKIEKNGKSFPLNKFCNKEQQKSCWCNL